MAALDLFEQILSDGWTGVEQWKVKRQEESFLLEFKGKRTPMNSTLEDADRDNLAKALSGFANVSGGVLVFGVHAKSSTDRIDHVSEIYPITDIMAFRGQVERRCKQLTDPHIAGIRVEHLECPHASGRGILLVYVPQSDGGPHRVSVGSTGINDRYYMRTVSETTPMPHALLAAMFGRIPPPQLHLQMLFRFEDTVAYEPTIRLFLRLLNRGRGYAQQPAIEIEEQCVPYALWYTSFSSSTHPDWQYITPAQMNDRVLFRSSANGVLFPEQTIQIANGLLGGGNPLKIPFAFSLTGRLFALGAQPVRFDRRIILDREDSLDFEVP